VKISRVRRVKDRVLGILQARKRLEEYLRPLGWVSVADVAPVIESHTDNIARLDWREELNILQDMCGGRLRVVKEVPAEFLNDAIVLDAVSGFAPVVEADVSGQVF